MKKFLIAQAEGGLMEKPDRDYTNQDWVTAKNATEAKEAYKKKWNPSYWQVIIIEEKQL